MVLGALLDAGLPFEELRAALGSLAIDGASVSARKVLRAGVSATKFSVHDGATSHITPIRTGMTTHQHEHATAAVAQAAHGASTAWPKSTR